MTQAMFDLFKKTREQWLQEARDAARKLLAYRDHITIEDVLEVCPKPEYLHRNTVGRVFDSEFQHVGFAKSKRVISKGRWIQQWRLR